MSPGEAESWFKVAVAVVSALAGIISTWALLRRDVADLKTRQASMVEDMDGIGTKINGLIGDRKADLGRFDRIEADIKDWRYFERGVGDRFTRERHDLVDREIHPLAMRLDERLDGLADEISEIKRGRGMSERRK